MGFPVSVEPGVDLLAVLGYASDSPIDAFARLRIMTSSTILSPGAYQLLHERFGYRDFRPGQEAVIAAVLQGHHVLAVMPTGSGKSLCYQLPALLREGCTVVISPLIALMKDQVDTLQAQGIAATFINSSLTAAEQTARLRACRAGAYDLLYVAPERFRSPRFLQSVAQTRVALFAVDEAHCISEWGHDFRPDYLRLREAIAHLQQPQVLALTATATVEVQQDIMQQLGCGEMQRFVTGFNRANLTYRVLALNAPTAKLGVLYDILAAQGEGSAIVYAATRRTVEEIAAFLHARGTEVLSYHAGLPDDLRRRTQEAFMARQQGVIVATNAFGMGVDKAAVRSVIHFNLPRSMEAYYQEAGRAGRDGGAAQCILLFSYGDVKIQEFLLEQSSPPRELIEEVYGLIVALSRRQAEIPLRALLPHRRHGSSTMQVDSSVKILEKAGYIERLASYDGVDEVIPGLSNMRVRLATEAVLPHHLELDYAALQRRKHREQQRLRQMVGYANTRQCRRRRILAYFGELWEQSNCGACDHCLDDRSFVGKTPQPKRAPEEAEWLLIQKILSCIARMRGRYGRARVMQVLMGSRAREIRDSHLTRLSTYGILRGTPRPTLEAYVDALVEAECVCIVGDEFPKLDLTPRGWAVMRRQQSVQLALPVVDTPVVSPALVGHVQAVPAATPPVVSVPSLTPEVVVPASVAPPVILPPAPEPAAVLVAAPDTALLERLRAQRTALARAEAIPPYCVFNDRTLREMAVHLPVDRPSLLQIHGVGEAKAAKYGEIFLDLIRDHTTARQ
jgi:ATP-dependent DNA helicase RecQ